MKITIDYLHEAQMTIIFDNIFEYDFEGSVQSAIEQIKWAFLQYGFNRATICSADTGEVIADISMEDEEN